MTSWEGEGLNSCCFLVRLGLMMLWWFSTLSQTFQVVRSLGLGLAMPLNSMGRTHPQKLACEERVPLCFHCGILSSELFSLDFNVTLRSESERGWTEFSLCWKFCSWTVTILLLEEFGMLLLQCASWISDSFSCYPGNPDIICYWLVSWRYYNFDWNICNLVLFSDGTVLHGNNDWWLFVVLRHC